VEIAGGPARSPIRSPPRSAPWWTGSVRELGILGDVPLDGPGRPARPSIVAEAITTAAPRARCAARRATTAWYGTIRLFDPGRAGGRGAVRRPQGGQGPARTPAPGRFPEEPPSEQAEPGRGGGGRPAAPWTRSSTRSSPTTGGPLLVVAGPGAGKTPGAHATRSRTGSAPVSRPSAAWPSPFTRPLPATSSATASPRCSARDAAARVTVATFSRSRPADPARAMQAPRPRRGPEGRGREDPPRRSSGRWSAGGSPAALGARIAESKRVRAFQCCLRPSSRTERATRTPAMTSTTVTLTTERAFLPTRNSTASPHGTTRRCAERGMVERRRTGDAPPGAAQLGRLARPPATRSGWTDVFVDEYQGRGRAAVPDAPPAGRARRADLRDRRPRTRRSTGSAAATSGTSSVFQEDFGRPRGPGRCPDSGDPGATHGAAVAQLPVRRRRSLRAAMQADPPGHAGARP